MTNKFANMEQKWEDRALVKEFRKIAQMANLDVSYFGKIISQRGRKLSKPIEKYHGRNLKYIPLIQKECKKFNIKSITILDPHLRIGEYGGILACAERLRYDNMHIFCIIDSKYIWKTIRKLYNPNLLNRWEKYEYEEGGYKYFYMPHKYHKIKYNSHSWDELIVLENGQVFDVGNGYRFAIEDSHKLTAMIKRGYEYVEPQYFFYDTEEYEDD